MNFKRCYQLVETLIFMALVGSHFLLAQRQLFHQYGSSDGLANLNVRCLLQDRTPYIWVGTDNGLFRYDGGKFRVIRAVGHS
jgi:ligand-binding sensor domain-containing protein